GRQHAAGADSVLQHLARRRGFVGHVEVATRRIDGGEEDVFHGRAAVAGADGRRRQRGQRAAAAEGKLRQSARRVVEGVGVAAERIDGDALRGGAGGRRRRREGCRGAAGGGDRRR